MKFLQSKSSLALFIFSLIIMDSRSQDSSYWRSQAQKTLQEHLMYKPILGQAKNGILFLGDGMGIPTVLGIRIYKGQLQHKPGEETILEFEKWPNVALSKTYNTDKQVSDSAGTATAYLCGSKTRYGTIGVDESVLYGKCSTYRKEADLSSILMWAKAAGKSVGLVTTTRITHASPAATFAHTPDRRWEADVDKIPGAEACEDISSQFIKNAQDFTVVFGGGRRSFYPNTSSDPEYPDKKGWRKDGRNLINEWINIQKSKALKYSYIYDMDGFNKLDTANVDRVLGLFEYSHMHYVVDRNNDKNSEPTQAEMIEKAIKILSKNPRGYFLFFEGGRIDHGHHDGKAKRAITEGIAFEEAITKAVSMVNIQDTLMVVTADHSHVMTIGGYPSRGNPLFGKNNEELGQDGIPYTTILYANGPGYSRNKATGGRDNISNVNTENINYRQQTAVPRYISTHSGEDVAIYATGPRSHIFRSVVEQNFIPHAMAYALCLPQSSCEEEYKIQSYLFSNAETQLRQNKTSLSIMLSVLLVYTFFDKNV